MLQLLAMKVPNVLTFDFMSKPSPGRWGLWEGVQNGQKQPVDSKKNQPGLPAVSFCLV